jgi:hypothetical protein
MKNKLAWLFWLAVIGGVGWYVIHHRRAQAKEHDVAEIRQQQTDASVAALVLQYHAVTNWTTGLPDRGFGEHYSIDIARALIGSNQQPVLVKCHLEDIAEKDGNIIASFSSRDANVYDLSLQLQCSPEQVITLTSTNQLTRFAVIARCHEVQRLSGEDGGFSVKGELLDTIQLP